MARLIYKELGLGDVLEFGKYAGTAIEDILNDDHDYIQWCLDNIKGFVLDSDAQDALELMQNEYQEDDDWCFPLDDRDDC